MYQVLSRSMVSAGLDAGAPEQHLLDRASEYRLCITLHCLGVRKLALTLLENRGEAFPRLRHNRDLVEGYLELHDRSKFDPRYFWELVKYFGVNFSIFMGQQKKKAAALIQEINSKDAENARMFFLTNGLTDEDGNPDATAEELMKLERICDVVERGLSAFSHKEFGRKVAKGSAYLSAADEVELALWLEQAGTYM